MRDIDMNLLMDSVLNVFICTSNDCASKLYETLSSMFNWVDILLNLILAS